MLRVIDQNITRSIRRFGHTFKYYRSSLCSCVADNSGHFDPACTCIQGYYYETPVEVVILRNNVSRKVEHSPNGVIYNGDLHMTIPKMVEAVEQKVYHTIDRGDVFVDLRKTRRDTDICRKGIRDKLLAFDVTEILRVAKLNTVYQEDIDYELVVSDATPHERTEISWIAGQGPDDGEHYTVDFLSKQQLKVFDGDYKFGGTDEEDLPRTVKCVFRKYVAKDGSPIDTVNVDENIYGENN